MPLVGFAFTNVALDFLETLPPKIRRQIVKRCRALHTQPFPPSCKRLHYIETPDGEPVFRERSGDYRILYVARDKPAEVLILDIDNRRDVYKMPKTNTEPADELRMSEAEFDDIMGRALGAPVPQQDDVADEPEKRLSAQPKKKNTNRNNPV